MAKVNLTVSVADSHLDRILDVAEGLRAAGLQVQQIMDAIGVIIGTCEAEQVGALSQVAGVAHIEKAQGFQLQPPDSPIQ
ncbi:ketohydroxyglutarate aldolase [Leptolyngbya sp. FACHB-36]|uniref:ketohydroxyglutarate aldolase n=1 Tax=Leptolyngbya sp. FACHB-36 TaxID=2692808 RepID=UPI0016808E9F|nr:ketohydroxyglutarate aldolase [Leptolyngbya sp. FACHB-36]MBD2020765.1 ketohydroxyglutarate aldolase [Leptolyngbya sp. FACHB-36]